MPFEHLAEVEEFFTVRINLRHRWEALDQLIFARTDGIVDKFSKPVVELVNLVFSTILASKLLVNAAYPHKE